MVYKKILQFSVGSTFLDQTQTTGAEFTIFGNHSKYMANRFYDIFVVRQKMPI